MDAIVFESDDFSCIKPYKVTIGRRFKYEYVEQGGKNWKL